MTTEHQYFYEDEVYRINRKGNVEFGMVLENSELVSSDESDVEEVVKLKKGYIRVAWHPTGVEEIVAERKVGLADRSLMPGDVVRRMIKGKDTQRGYCRHMQVTACVQVVGTNLVLNNVPSTQLVPIEELASDMAVCLDSWVGGIKIVHSKLFLRLPDKSTCVITDPDSNGFDVFTDKRNKDSEFSLHGEYYPGQTLWGPVSVLSEVTDWKPHIKNHTRTKSCKNIKVVVEDVKVESVAVHWQCRAYSKEGTTGSKEQPKVWIGGEDLARIKFLNVFEPCTLQVGDRTIYYLKANDEILTKDEWRRNQKKLISNGHDPPPLQIPSKTAKGKVPEETKNILEENGHSKNCKDGSLDDGDTDWYTDTSEGNDSDLSNSSAASTGTIKKQPNSRAFLKHIHKKKVKRSTKKNIKVPETVLNPGAKLIVETVSTKSTADVVWQDGTVEHGIPSTELYPIHHLDDQEFFPGDFVIENRDDACMRIYGVVQKVDHGGRIASVKWFRTYTSSDNPQPTLLMESEVSVYDLKDHPDFQYRPGTVVIRVANFTGDDENSTAGQVLDNYPEGRVGVWWAEGHVSMCWPQDLYKVGDYDSDEGELWDDPTSDESSWMTDSDEPSTADFDNEEEVTTEDKNLKPKLAANIEKARVAMSRLAEIFTQNPSLQTTDVMKKLLEVYKDCRYLDKLMGTGFFHECHFEGLIERVREKRRTSSAQKVEDQLNRLFKSPQHGEKTGSASAPSTTGNQDSAVAESCEQQPLSNVCVKLCSLMLGQLLQAHAEVMNRFGCGVNSRLSLSEAAKSLDSSSSSCSSQNPNVPEVELDSNKSSTDQPASTETVENKVREEEKKENPVTQEVNGFIEVENGSSPSAQLGGEFSIMDTAPNTHKYKLGMFHPTYSKTFFRTLREEMKLLQTSLPSGIWVKAFEDRVDLFSVMISGPEKTPYEGGLFLFDLQLTADYPKTPPHCHYISYCSDRLNPNLYEDGKVCISLLGTWSGKGTEVWTSQSNLLQILISIQGLILVREPYFNEAGYEKQKGSQQGHENSRMYNEMVILKLVQSMTKIATFPPAVFAQEIKQHLDQHALSLCQRLENWLEVSEQYNQSHPNTPTTPTILKHLDLSTGGGVQVPEFPLIPASRGFCITLRKSLAQFRQVLIDFSNQSTLPVNPVDCIPHPL